MPINASVAILLLTFPMFSSIIMKLQNLLNSIIILTSFLFEVTIRALSQQDINCNISNYSTILSLFSNTFVQPTYSSEISMCNPNRSYFDQSGIEIVIQPNSHSISDSNLPEESRNTGTFIKAPGNLSNHTYVAEH